MAIKVFVMETCPDCTQVKAQLRNRPGFLLIDIGEHVRHLKEFIRLRDQSPAFDAAKAKGALGIPCGGLAALAACLFVLSDIMVCRQVVMPVSLAFDVSALGIYYAAQLLFGAACALL